MTRPSPRTPAAPAAFSAGEVAAGGALTLAAYIPVSVVWYSLTGFIKGWWFQPYGIVGVFGEIEYGLLTAVPAVVVGTLTAALLGRALRDRASWPRHLLAHAVHAYAIGAIAALVLNLVIAGGALTPDAFYYLFLDGGPAAAASALIGWRSIVAIARHRDAKRAARGIAAAPGA